MSFLCLNRAYSGSNEGWTLTPPYFAAVSNLEGTNRPKETATIRSIGPSGGYLQQLVIFPVLWILKPTHGPSCESI